MSFQSFFLPILLLLGFTSLAEAQCLSGNCHHGEGIYTYTDGSKYEGQFSNDQPQGWGTWYYPNGDKYIGMFEAGKSHGRGTMYFVNGQKLTGLWAQGKYTNAQEEKENQKEGCISGNCKLGKGTYVFKHGKARYEGYFYNSLPHGEGTCYYANGDRYEGEWANGKFEGHGILYSGNGSVRSGFWKEGSYLGAQYIDSENKDAQGDVMEPSGPPKIWAVIIGVANYGHMPALRYTDDDAYRVYAFLKSPEGGALPDEQIQVLVDEEATKKNIVTAMMDVFYKAEPQDLIMLYFSGHGLKGSFLPVDFDGYNNKLFHHEINGILENSRAQYKLCIADACHSGSLLSDKSGDMEEVMDDFYENLAQATPGTALIMSSKSNETSLESSGLRQGVFTHFLIRGLKGEADTDEDSLVNITELYDFIYSGVRSYTAYRQSPMIRGNFDEAMPVSVSLD